MVADTRRDEELLADHLAGRSGAFESLVARYVPELFAFLYRFVGDRAAADDLVQETFLQVHLSAGSFDPQRAFKPWLYTISANKARDYLRQRGRRHEASLDSPGVDGDGQGAAAGVAANGPDAVDQLADGERRELVRRLIDRMPEHLREILLLGYFQQLPYADIAEALDIPVGTVKSRLHAAVTHFARLWEQRVGSGAGES